MPARRKHKASPSSPDSPQHQRKLNKCFTASATCPLNSVSDWQTAVRAFPALLPLLIHSCFPSPHRRVPALCADAGHRARSGAVRFRGSG